MRSYLVGDNTDTLVGMHLAGTPGALTHDISEIRKALNNAIEMKDVAVVSTIERLISICPELAYDLKLNLKRLSIVEISGRHDNGRTKNSITRYVRETIGAEIQTARVAERGVTMAPNDEKLGKLSSAIDHYAQGQRERIEQGTAKYEQAQLGEAEHQVLHETYQLIWGEMTATRDEIMRDIVHRETDTRKQLLEKRKNIENEVLNETKNRLIDYTKSAQYPSLLRKYICGPSELFPESGTVLCVEKDDLQCEDLLRQAFVKDCVVQADQDTLIGGVCVFHAEKGIMADGILDTMLESQQEWFEETSGMSVV